MNRLLTLDDIRLSGKLFLTKINKVSYTILTIVPPNVLLPPPSLLYPYLGPNQQNYLVGNMTKNVTYQLLRKKVPGTVGTGTVR